MKLPLTPRQKQVLDTVREFIATCGYPPSLRELGDLLGIRSTNGTREHLMALRNKGWIDWREYKSRTLKVLP